MLEIRPNCEYCDRDLPPAATDACICTYECTFCADCVEHKLQNVCPNCGGGFVPRPIRPRQARRKGVSLIDQPADLKRRTLNYDKDEIAAFVASVKDIPVSDR